VRAAEKHRNDSNNESHTSVLPCNSAQGGDERIDASKKKKFKQRLTSGFCLSQASPSVQSTIEDRKIQHQRVSVAAHLARGAIANHDKLEDAVALAHHFDTYANRFARQAVSLQSIMKAVDIGHRILVGGLATVTVASTVFLGAALVDAVRKTNAVRAEAQSKPTETAAAPPAQERSK
jgi:hypothetical protein